MNKWEKHLTLRQIIERGDYKKFLTSLGVKVIERELEGTLGKKTFLVTSASYQSNSDYSYRCVRQAQGAIIDPETDKIVSVGLEKFFNYQEEFAPTLPTQIKVTEKRDGSNVRFFYHREIGVVMVSKMGINFEYKVPVRDGDRIVRTNLKDLIMKVPTYEKIVSYMNAYKPHETYIFEFISPDNQIVLRYEEPELNAITVVGVSEFGDFVEYPALTHQFPNPTKATEELVLTDDLIKLMSTLEDKEGFVGRTKTGERVKFKTEWYFEKHYNATRSAVTLKQVLKVIQSNTEDDVLSYWADKPELQEEYFQYKETIHKVVGDKVDEANRIAEEHKDLEPKTFFALVATNYFNNPWAGKAYTIKKKYPHAKLTLWEVLDSIKYQTLRDLVDDLGE